jgi:hypothetical protein
MSDCPTLLLGGQQRVNAYNFKHMASAATPDDAEAGTNALLAHLRTAAAKLRESGGRTLADPNG